MKATRTWLVALLSIALILALGVVLAACGGGATTTTQPPTTTATGPIGSAPAKIVVDLSGDQVVPPVQTSASGTFTLMIETSPSGTFNISYQLDVKDIVDVTAAHIHLGAAGTNGDVIVPLFTGPPKTGSFTGTLASGTITEADLTGPMQGKTFQDLAGVVLAGGTYVNVHTTANPNGEIRGQIVVSGIGGATTTTGAGGGAVTTTTAAGGY